MSALSDQAAAIVAEAATRIGSASAVSDLKALDTELLGKASVIGSLKASLRDLPDTERKDAGRAIGEARAAIEGLFEARHGELAATERRALLQAERLDLSEVIPSHRLGHLHPIRQVSEWLEDVFVGMGYTVEEGPEIETDWYNFEALNMPIGHSARSMWDTLYLNIGEPETVVLRTHTSPVQIRSMHSQAPPIYMIAPGKAFRLDTADATHLPMFHQIEGLVIDEGITFADLAGTIELFVKALFGDDRTTRLRPSYFPFTEPSAEFDMSTADGDWVELGGCGMVHPNVLRAGGIDPERWGGFAFGFGIDRLAMQRFAMSDIRELVGNDIRFLEQF